MIYTITLNPSIDYYVSVENSVYEKEVNRASEELLVPAGKGINISKTLNNFGIDNTAIILVGGFTGNYIYDKLQEYPRINVEKIDVEGNSRINVKVKDAKSNFAVNGIGPKANGKCEDQIIESLHSVKEDDYIIISGSMMPGLSFETLVKISELVHSKKAKLVIDMACLKIEQLAMLKPDLIKPNQEELYAMTNECDIDKAIRKLKENGISTILLSLGKDGFNYYSDSDKCNVYVSEVNAINNVGCGDNLLAGFVASRAEGNIIKEALKFAGACASASVCTLDDITLGEVVKYIKGIKVRYDFDK